LHTASSFLYDEETQNNLKKTFTYSEKSEEQRRQYVALLAEIPVVKRVYVDESGVATCLVCEYGRSL